MIFVYLFIVCLNYKVWPQTVYSSVTVVASVVYFLCAHRKAHPYSRQVLRSGSGMTVAGGLSVWLQLKQAAPGQPQIFRPVPNSTEGHRFVFVCAHPLPWQYRHPSAPGSAALSTPLRCDWLPPPSVPVSQPWQCGCTSS